MRPNFREGFRRIFVLLDACWIVGWLPYLLAYTPVKDALDAQQRDREGADYTFTQCRNRAAAAEALFNSEESMAEAARLEGRQDEKRSSVTFDAPYGLDPEHRPLTKDQALALANPNATAPSTPSITHRFQLT